jgi:hypothetical protein
VKVELNGTATIEWQETVIKHTIYYKAQEKYLECTQNLIGKVELMPGTYIFGFSFMLPHGLPASFEGHFGAIRYWITATIDFSFEKMEKEDKLITVNAPLDLRLRQEYATPCILTEQKKFGSLFCTSGPFSVTVRMPAKAYLPGQSICFNVECNNASNSRIKRLSIKLIRRISYKSHKPIHKIKTDCMTIGELSFQAISAGESRSWKRYLDIPPDIIAYLRPCKIITFEYFILVEAKANIFCYIPRYLYSEMPIVLGNSCQENIKVLVRKHA